MKLLKTLRRERSTGLTNYVNSTYIDIVSFYQDDLKRLYRAFNQQYEGYGSKSVHQESINECMETLTPTDLIDRYITNGFKIIDDAFVDPAGNLKQIPGKNETA